MGKIASAENPDAHQQPAERWRQRLKTDQERSLRARGHGAFTHQEPERRDGDGFDSAEPDRSRADGSQKCGEHGRCGFVAPVAEETGEADAEDGPVEPGLTGSRVFHKGIPRSFYYFFAGRYRMTRTFSRVM